MSKNNLLEGILVLFLCVTVSQSAPNKKSFPTTTAKFNQLQFNKFVDRILEKSRYEEIVSEDLNQYAVVNNNGLVTRYKMERLIFGRSYLLQNILDLYVRVLATMDSLRYFSKKKNLPPTEELEQVKNMQWRDLKQQLSSLYSNLEGMSDDELLQLFWRVQEAIKNGELTPDGNIVIDGKEYNVDELMAYCCPFR